MWFVDVFTADLRCKFDWQLQDRGWIVSILLKYILLTNYSVKTHPLSCISDQPWKTATASGVLDGAYLADFGIDVIAYLILPKSLKNGE